ncbi:glycosyltransferase family 4 protein [Curvivirga aplysinae]|uniref:glycosyltransferase family 4 protein n=1 Tax=Curvivirga aplysinae TaxID=2529852 RepID=UPI001C3FCF8F|nr:glycosyltransferase family 4 protein [Curvivirga aplysinae]
MTKSNFKIAVVANSFFGIGGAENSTQSLVRSLTKDGYSVTVFLPDKERSKQPEKPDFNIRYFPNETLFISFRDIILNRDQKINLCADLIDFRAIHFCMLNTMMALFPYFRHRNWSVTCRGGDIQNPRKTNYKEIVRNSPYRIAYKGFRTKVKNEVFLRIFLLWYRKSGHFITISEDMLSELKALGVPTNKAHKILNGVDTVRLDKILSSTYIAKRSEKTKYIYAIGRNDSRKGFYTLLDAAMVLRDRSIDNIRFLLKGRGFNDIVRISEELNVERYFTVIDENHNIDFKVETFLEDDGQIPDVPTVALYKIADIVIIPSLIEALSNIGLESEVADKPLIVSDTFGCREYITRETAIGFRTADATDLVDQIISVLSDQNIQDRLRRMRQIRQKQNNKDNFVQKYKEIILGKNSV